MTGKHKSTRERFGAVFFAFIMVTSMVAAGAAFAGSAAAQSTANTTTVNDDGGADSTSLQSAVNSATSGDTIEIQGEYSVNQAITVSGTTDLTITGNETAVLNNTQINRAVIQIESDNTTVSDLTLNSSDANVINVKSTNVSVERVTINSEVLTENPSNDPAIGTAGASDVSGLSITDSTIDGAGIGISPLGDAEYTLSGNTINRTAKEGAFFFGGSVSDANLTITGNTITNSAVRADSSSLLIATENPNAVNGETDLNAQRQTILSQNTLKSGIEFDSVGSEATQSTDDITDEAAQINVSVSDPVGIDESTINVSVTGAGSTTNLVVNGTATDNVTATGSNATFDNDQNDSVESINVTAQLPEDKGGYNIDVSADNTAGATISNTFADAFTVDMAGEALQVTADSNNAFANTDGGAPAADETANVSVTAIDRFGNELNVSDGNINVSSSEITLTSQDGSISISGPTSGNATRNNATTFNVSNTEVETVTLTALDTNAANSTLTRGSAEQTYVADIAGLDVTASESNLPADDDTNASVTAQLVDSGGEVVPRGGIAVSYSIENSSAAGVGTPDGQSDTTNANGAATINITADTAGETVTVTAIEQGTGNGFSDETVIETVSGNISAANSEFELNSLGPDTDVTAGAGVQVATKHDLFVRLNDNENNPVRSMLVGFSSNQSGASFSSTTVNTNSSGVAATTVTLPEQKGTTQINVSAGAFNASGTSSAQINVTSVAANATTLQFDSDASQSIAPNSDDNAYTVELADQFRNVNTSSSSLGDVTLTTSDTSVIELDGSESVSQTLSDGSTTFTVDANGTGTATLDATVSDSNISNVSFDVTVAEPAAIQLTPAHNVVTSDAADGANQATLEAQFVNANGVALGVPDENITFAKQSGSSAELNQSDTFRKSTDNNGNVTIDVNGTATTGDTSFIALAENFSAQGTATVTTTGAADGLSVTPENDSVSANGTTNVTVEFVDTEGRNVPIVDTNIRVSTDNGEVTDSPQPTTLGDDGQVTATLTYNASSASAGTANLTAVGGGVSGTATVSVSGQADTGSPLGGTAGEYDGDGNGQVTASELGNAVTAFGQGDLTASELGDVVTAFGQS